MRVKHSECLWVRLRDDVVSAMSACRWREQGWYRDDSSLCVVRHAGIFCVDDQMICVHEMMAKLHQAEKSADYFPNSGNAW